MPGACRAGRTVRMLVLTQAIMILAVAAVLFVGVHWLEPNHRLALVLKLAILAAGAAAIARPLLPQPYTLPRVHTHQFPTEFAQAQCAVQAKQFLGGPSIVGVGMARPHSLPRRQRGD